MDLDEALVEKIIGRVIQRVLESPQLAQYRDEKRDQKPVRLLREPEVLERLGVSRSTLHRWRAEGRVSKPMRASANVVVWLESDIDADIERMAAQGYEPRGNFARPRKKNPDAWDARRGREGTENGANRSHEPAHSSEFDGQQLTPDTARIRQDRATPAAQTEPAKAGDPDPVQRKRRPAPRQTNGQRTMPVARDHRSTAKSRTRIADNNTGGSIREPR